MSDLFGGIIGSGFVIDEVLDHPWGGPDLSARPGSWSHEMAYNVAMIIVASLATPKPPLAISRCL